MGCQFSPRSATIHRPRRGDSFKFLVSSSWFAAQACVAGHGINQKPETRDQKLARMYELLREYGLWAVFFGTMLEGDLTLLLAGVLARAGLFTFGEAMLVGTAGGLVGDSLSYFIGARFRNRARTLKVFMKARGRIEKLMSRFGVLS